MTLDHEERMREVRLGCIVLLALVALILFAAIEAINVPAPDSALGASSEERTA